MEIQRIEELHDDTTALNDRTDDGTTQSNIRKDGISTHHDHEDGYPADLVSKFDTEEGPEVFKRVRFLSRWEFRRESRGCLFSKIGHYNWWLADCPEALAMNVILDNVFRESSDVPLWFRLGGWLCENHCSLRRILCWVDIATVETSVGHVLHDEEGTEGSL